MLNTDYAVFKQMVIDADPDFNCDTLLYPYCYSAVNTCDAYWDRLQNLSIYLNSNKYVILPQGYTISNAWDGWPCVVAVTNNKYSTDMMILGDTFLRNFVVSFDYKKNTVSLAVSANATQGTLAVQRLSWYDVLLIILGCLFAVGFVVYFFWKKR